MFDRVGSLVDDYLLLWVLLSAVAGYAVPDLARITRFSTPILAVMVGSVSLTLSVADFRELTPRAATPALIGHLLMPFLAFGVARALGLAPGLTTGFVVLGAVTPELVTPVMTELADGDTALASAVLVATGVGSLAVVPLVVGLLVGGVAVDPLRIVKPLLAAVVAPMAVAVAIRTRSPGRVGRYDDRYPTVAALMVVLVIAGVTAANTDLLRSDVVPAVLAGAIALNVGGYAVGWVLGRGLSRPRRTATTLSVGMRDFAVAAALAVAAGLPPSAALPAVAFGVVELSTSAGLAAVYSRTSSR